jgi:hypothetical protein
LVYFPALLRGGKPTFLQVVESKDRDLAEGFVHKITNVWGAKDLIRTAFPRQTTPSTAAEIMSANGVKCPHPATWTVPIKEEFDLEQFLMDTSPTRSALKKESTSSSQSHSRRSLFPDIDLTEASDSDSEPTAVLGLGKRGRASNRK